MLVKNKAAVAGFSVFAAALILSVIPATFRNTFAFAASGLSVATVLFLGIRGTKKASAIGASFMALSVAAGLIGFTVYDLTRRQPVYAAAGTESEIIGTVEEKKELSFYTAVYTVKTDINGVSTRILLTAPDVYGIDLGDKVKTRGTLYQIRDNGIFAEKTYNFSKGILLQGTVNSLELVEHGKRTPLRVVREYNEFFKSEIMSAFPVGDTEAGAILCAFFAGDKSELSTNMSQSIKRAGISHYAAVSGLHITAIVHVFGAVIKVTPFGRNRRVKFGFFLALIALTALFFNLTMSVLRASVMLTIYYGGELFMRKSTALNSLGLAILLILLFQPYAVFDAGLIMSFLGTFGVGVVAPSLLTTWRKSGKQVHPITELLTVSVCANLCVLPSCAFFFGGISLWSPLTSLLILPLFSVAGLAVITFFALFILSGLFSLQFLDVLGKSCLIIAGFAAKSIAAITDFFGGFSRFWIPLDYPFVACWTAFAAVSASLTSALYKSVTKSVKAVSVTAAALAVMVCVYNVAAVKSGRTYISVHSDSVSAWVNVKSGNTEFSISTSDTPTALSKFGKSSGTFDNSDSLVLLKSTRNNAEDFGGVSEQGLYDINGKFTLDVGENHTVLDIDGFTVLFTRAADDSAPPADIVVARGAVRNKRAFDASYVVYVSRSIPAEGENEYNAYYEPFYIVIE